MSTYPDEERERAQVRWAWLQVVRIASIAALLIGLAITRSVIEANWWLGVELANQIAAGSDGLEGHALPAQPT